jgi:signal peptidase II
MLINQTQKAILLIAFFVLIIDRLAKSLALSIWQFEAVPLSSWFKLSFATNPNISFSLPFSGPLLYLGLLVAILILIYYCLSFLRQAQIWPSLFIGLIISGALSNAFDRLRYGAVIDYLELHNFSVFNLADALICAGSAALIYYLLINDPIKQKSSH